MGKTRPRLGSGCLLHRQVEEEQELMTKDDVLFGYRVQLFAEAARTNVSRRAGRSECIARRTTRGSARSTGTAWRCCARVSVGVRRCPTRWRRWSRSASSRSRSRTPGWDPSVSRQNSRARSGWHPGLAQRRMEGAVPSRPEHPRQAPARCLGRSLGSTAGVPELLAGARGSGTGRQTPAPGRRRLPARYAAVRRSAGFAGDHAARGVALRALCRRAAALPLGGR
jgi:hypothetical protein